MPLPLVEFERQVYWPTILNQIQRSKVSADYQLVLTPMRSFDRRAKGSWIILQNSTELRSIKSAQIRSIYDTEQLSCDNIGIFFSPKESQSDFDEGALTDLEHTIRLFKKILQQGHSKVLVCSVNSIPADHTKSINLPQSYLFGMLNSICVERGINIHLVDFDSEANLFSNAEKYFWIPQGFTATKVVDSNEYSVQIAKLKDLDKTVFSFNPHSTYVVVGGGGALGSATVAALLDLEVSSIVILGRSKSVLDRIEGNSSIISYTVDVGDIEALRQVFSTIQHRHPPIRGVIHSAGYYTSIPLEEIEAESLLKTLRPKSIGSMNLHKIADELQLDLDHFIFYSSIASLIGQSRGISYACANGIQDGLAVLRQLQRKPCSSINWGLWESGMGSLDLLSSFTTKHLHVPITEKEGIAAIKQVLSRKDFIGAIANIKWNTLVSATRSANRNIINDALLKINHESDATSEYRTQKYEFHEINEKVKSCLIKVQNEMFS